MNLEETRKILQVLRINYPMSFKGMSPDDTQAYLKLWNVSFKDYPYIEVANAVNSIIQSDIREFAPNVAIVKKKINSKFVKATIDSGEAWEMVLRKASCNSAKALKNYQSLSQNIQRALGGSYMLVDIGYSSKDNIGYLRDKFIKKYEGIQETEINELSAGFITEQEYLDHDSKGNLENKEGLQKLNFKGLLESSVQ